MVQLLQTSLPATSPVWRDTILFSGPRNWDQTQGPRHPDPNGHTLYVYIHSTYMSQLAWHVYWHAPNLLTIFIFVQSSARCVTQRRHGSVAGQWRVATRALYDRWWENFPSIVLIAALKFFPALRALSTMSVDEGRPHINWYVCPFIIVFIVQLCQPVMLGPYQTLPEIQGWSYGSTFRVGTNLGMVLMSVKSFSPSFLVSFVTLCFWLPHVN